MTAAGERQRSTIWRMVNENDDAVGGAVISGTVAYAGVMTRLDSRPIEQLLLQQGYETERTFTAVVVPGWLDIRERDELEITHPIDDVYYGKRFRIVSVQHSSHNRRDRRNYIILDLRRSIRAHTKQ